MNPVTKSISYLREVREEMHKVTWPSRKETTRYSLIVIAISLGMGAFFAVLDFGFQAGLDALLELTA